MRPGEVYLAAFRSATFPASISEVLVAYISSMIPAQLLPLVSFRIRLSRSVTAVIREVASALRLHKLATIHCSSPVRHPGVIDSRQHAAVAVRLRELLVL